jgi:GNAT superfamily N-acetyltransferase
MQLAFKDETDLKPVQAAPADDEPLSAPTRGGVMTMRRIVDCSPELAREIHRVCMEAPGYFLCVEGAMPEASTVERWFSEDELPLFCLPEQSHFFGAWIDGRLVGFVHILAGYRDPEQATISLQLISERYQRQGLGRVLFSLLAQRLLALGMRSARVAVVASNKGGIQFWHAMGFEQVCETAAMDGFLDKTLVMDKSLV